MTKKELYEKFIFAIRDNELETVKECIKKGVNVNQCFDLNGSTPIYLCLKKSKDPRMFQLLVKSGADVSKRYGSGKEWEKFSLLHYALSFGDVPKEIVKIILENGGDRDISYAPKGNLSPLEKTLNEENEDLLKLFSKYCDFRVSPKFINHDLKDNKKIIKKGI